MHCAHTHTHIHTYTHPYTHTQTHTQAEHDVEARPILICTHAPLIKAVDAEVKKQLDLLPQPNCDTVCWMHIYNIYIFVYACDTVFLLMYGWHAVMHGCLCVCVAWCVGLM